MFPKFIEFKKIPRLNKEIIITEKIDGTNGVILVCGTLSEKEVNRHNIKWNTVRDLLLLRHYGEVYSADNYKEIRIIKSLRLSLEHITNEFGNEFIPLINELAELSEKELSIYAGSRTRWLWGSIQDEIHNDNYGFAKWVKENQGELKKLGIGNHYGEWMGQGIQRNYGLKEKRFYLFNTSRWIKYEGIAIPELSEGKHFCPDCCYIVPILQKGLFDTHIINTCLENLWRFGSYAIPNFMNPEGIVIYHIASKTYFKKTIENDDKRKIE